MIRETYRVRDPDTDRTFETTALTRRHAQFLGWRQWYATLYGDFPRTDADYALHDSIEAEPVST